MVEINRTEQAIEDIQNIAGFIAKDSVRYAKLQTLRFFETVEILRSHTHAGRIVPELNEKTIRELIPGNYRIIYRIVSEERIDILAIHHGRQLLKKNPEEE